MSESLSARKFAELVGVSNVQISKLVKQGRLPVTADGKIPKAAGLCAYEATQKLGYENTRAHNARVREENKAAKAPKQEKPKDAKVEAVATLPQGRAPTPPADDDDNAPLMQGGKDAQRAAAMYNLARAKKEAINAQLQDLKLKQAKGELVDRAMVRQEAATLAAEVRELLLTIPPRAAPLCEGKPAREIEGIIDREINEALAKLQGNLKAE